MAPKISILMGIYNCASTLPEAIDSVLAQTFPDWELILCDDGSSDDTYQVAQTYRTAHPDRIILIRNDRNRGLNYTLNHCLAHARGELIARMDGDDLSVPERLEKEYAALMADPSLSVVSCAMSYFDEHGEFTRANTLPEYPEPRMLVHGTIHCHAPCLMRAEAIRGVGGYSVDEKLLRVEDWHLWLKIYAAGGRGRNLPEVLYKMRDDRDAAGRRKFKFRLNEAHVARLAVKTFSLPKWYYLYTLRPILVGLLPAPVYRMLHRKKMSRTG
ncbi:MAG: glycosyltransferase [Oscillospiraceae bacterium]|nr:glycosyltransferase [Oscillospiraceae bacterium]